MKHDYALSIRSLAQATATARGDQKPWYGWQPQPPNEPTIAHRFTAICQQHAGRPSMQDRRGELSYQWLYCQANHLAQHLIDHPDFETGSHVGLCLPNSPEYVVAFFAVQLAGGVAVPIPPYQQGKRRRQQIAMTNLKLMIEDERISADQKTTRDNRSIRLNATTAPLESQPVRPMGHLAALLFTSGSSGDPKAVMLSHRNILANTQSISQVLPLGSTDRTLANMPFAHALGNSVLQTHILNGATLVFSSDLLFPTALLNALETQNCTSLIAVPEVFDFLLRALGTDCLQSSCLRYMAVAGGRLEPTRAAQLADQIAPAEFFIMYGQTEATARLACLPSNQIERQADTIGHPIPGVEFCIRDPQGVPVQDGEVGTLHARGDNIMLGYWDDPETNRLILNDGWLNTGDRARKNPSGNYKICGRENGLVKIQGYRFHPNEIDNTLQALMPDAEFVTVPYRDQGQTRLALFVRPCQESLDVSQIRQACSRELPRHMVPQLYQVVSQWPVNSAHKIDRQELAVRASQAGLQSNYNRSA
ncbi:MAG: acyl--CoA ligase [Mariniblastus sp.]|nr:acyl--CoA ligase [Mariniblastus sp.]